MKIGDRVRLKSPLRGGRPVCRILPGCEGVIRAHRGRATAPWGVGWVRVTWLPSRWIVEFEVGGFLTMMGEVADDADALEVL